MKTSQNNHLLKWNSLLWVAAMILPGILSIAFSSTKFPWPIIIPLLLLGPMLGSNKMLVQAIGTNAGARTLEEPNV
jgi:hypothetical protein